MSNKIEKKDVNLDEVLIQASMVMVQSVDDADANGTDMKYSIELPNGIYNVDIKISKN